MRARVALPLIALLALAVPAGCGSGNGGSGSSSIATISSLHVPAPKVATQFLAAAKNGDGALACSLMTPAAVSDLARHVAATGQGKPHPARDCASYFKTQTSIGGALPNLTIGRVTVSGSRGRAAVECPACRPKIKKRFHPLPLQKTPLGWRVDYDYRRGY